MDKGKEDKLVGNILNGKEVETIISMTQVPGEHVVPMIPTCLLFLSSSKRVSRTGSTRMMLLVSSVATARNCTCRANTSRLNRNIGRRFSAQIWLISPPLGCQGCVPVDQLEQSGQETVPGVGLHAESSCHHSYHYDVVAQIDASAGGCCHTVAVQGCCILAYWTLHQGVSTGALMSSFVYS